MDISFSFADIKDYSKVEKLLLQLHNKHARAYADFYNELDIFNSLEEYEKIIGGEGRILLLATKSEEIVGLLWAEVKEKIGNKYVKNRKELWLEGIVVDDQYKKLGIGKLLMDELINIGKSGNFDSIELMVWKNNDEAINLYKKYFEERAIIMTYPL